MDDEPEGALDLHPLRQNGHKIGAGGRHEVRQHADAAAGRRQLHLGVEVGGLHRGAQAFRDLVEIV